MEIQISSATIWTLFPNCIFRALNHLAKSSLLFTHRNLNRYLLRICVHVCDNLCIWICVCLCVCRKEGSAYAYFNAGNNLSGIQGAIKLACRPVIFEAGVYTYVNTIVVAGKYFSLSSSVLPTTAIIIITIIYRCRLYNSSEQSSDLML